MTIEPAFENFEGGHKAGRPQIVWTTDIPNQGPTGACDRRMLVQALTNLLQNAAAFSYDDGEVRLRTDVGKAHVDILIEDDGEGVDPEDLPRLMHPFEQGENALVRRVEGAGLGLTICELTSAAMGAKLKLTSRPGKGLTARLRLRRA